MIEMHHSLINIQTLMTGESEECDQPDENTERYGDGGIRAPEEENNSPNDWITDFSVPNIEVLSDQEPGS